MTKVALIEKTRSRTDFDGRFDNAFEYDRYALCSDSTKKKVLKKDVDIEINIDDYDWIILIGSESLKYYTKVNSITEYSGRCIDDKFLPAINPAMLAFKPEARPLWEESKSNIIKYISGELKMEKLDEDMCYGITETEELHKFLQNAIDHDNQWVAVDTETTGLYPRDGYILGISMSYEKDHGAYISTDCIDEKAEHLFQFLFNHKIVVFHNAKFDVAMLEYHFGFSFPRFEDTMLLHYCLEEQPGTHGLKQLAMRFTPYGDYEQPMHDWIDGYRKANRILKDNFTWDTIPFDIMKVYAAMDAVVTLLVFERLYPAVKKNSKLFNVYQTILLPACRFLTDVQDAGVPFDSERLEKSRALMQEDIDEAVRQLYEFDAVKTFERIKGKEFNPNSTVKLRVLLFDFVGLKPTGIKEEQVHIQQMQKY